MAITLHPSILVHPGPWLKEEIVKPHQLTVTQVSEMLDVSRQNMSLFLNGHASLTALMALRFEKAFGISADTLMRMQNSFDIAQARKRSGDIKVARFVA